MVNVKANNGGGESPELQPQLTDCVGTQIRVRLCLRRMFGRSERARCVMRVPVMRSVQWLVQRVHTLFQCATTALLHSHTVLVCSGHVLLPDQMLAVLDPDDLIEVIPLYYNYGDEDERKFYQNFTSWFHKGTNLENNQKITKQRREDLYSDTEHFDSHPETAGSEVEMLHKMKFHALGLLDTFDECLTTPSSPHHGSPARAPEGPIIDNITTDTFGEHSKRRRRHRVRRRRTPYTPQSAQLQYSFQTTADVMVVEREGGGEGAVVVQQNVDVICGDYTRSITSRAPRLVCADTT